MGEYAKRKSDGERIKIGTCESMYYLRYEDKDKVTPDLGSCFGVYYRIPFVDEDGMRLGDYPDPFRGLRLYKERDESGYYESFADPETVKYPGTIQLTHECGLLVNVKCFHGEKLPESSEDVKAHWNGKSWSYELAHIKDTGNGLVPVVHCRHCRSMWSYSWADILPYTHGKMKARLEAYAGVIRVEEVENGGPGQRVFA